MIPNNKETRRSKEHRRETIPLRCSLVFPDVWSGRSASRSPDAVKCPLPAHAEGPESADGQQEADGRDGIASPGLHLF